MDAPLLALTGRASFAQAANAAAPEMAATENMRQLIQLRWMAVAGQLLTILAVDFGLGVPLPLGPMLGVVAALALGNLASTALLWRRRVTNLELTLALLFDMAALTFQLHNSGGPANPFISFYLLQVVLAAILLERWSAWVLVAVAALCFGGLTFDSRPLLFPPNLRLAVAEVITLGTWISFVLTSTLLALFITRISRNLRARDVYLADLRQRAAEEDGIVRMGLFASGAAHELGTPLASLSVILNDWRHMPRIAHDPELASELDEMQAEVQRCKTIVTDILHSAGEPRGEAMEAIPAAAFLGEVAAEWRLTHAAVPLEQHCENLGRAALAAGASLRQAVWNLLDNAAELSPSGIALHAARDGVELTIAVIDRGPGFTAEQLAAVGKPYQSRKGEGHGLGLFLAANVARRLGGRLEATNREGGGAQVRLVLPLGPA